MARITVVRVEDVGEDRLQIIGTVDDEPVIAFGWVSAHTNHFERKHYGADGHLRDSAKPREMTDRERMAYWKRLLAEAAPASPTVLFEAG